MPPDSIATTAPVLVTGASGFLGRSIVTTLQAAGIPVRAFDVVPPPEGTHPQSSLVGDVSDPASVAKACVGARALVIAHMAPNRPEIYANASLPFDINVKGTALLCEEAAKQGIHRVVLISSTAVVDAHRAAGRRLTRDLPPAPLSLYGLTKHLQEEILSYHQSAGRFSAISLRPAYVTDADTLTDKYQRQRPSVNWQFIDRRDVADAVLAALTAGLQSQGRYYLHGHPAGADHMDTSPTARDLGWSPAHDFSHWPDDAATAPKST